MSESTAVDKPAASTVCVSPFATRPILYTDTVRGKEVHRDDLWAVTTEELNALHQSLTAAEKPLVMADGSPFADYLRNTVPEDTPMDDWTKGYETCKRRLAAILLPQMEAK